MPVQLVGGMDPDFAKRDLYNHLASGKQATWRFCVQLMTEEQSKSTSFDPFDVTKVRCWRPSDCETRHS